MGTAGIWLLALASVAQDGQDVVSPERGATQLKPGEERVLGSAEFRFSTLKGKLTDSNEDVESTDWDEVFKDGYGLGLDLAWWIPVGPRFHAGPYAGVSLDVFQGERIRDEDVFGPEILTFDHLMTTRFLLGVGARQTFGRVFLEERVGAGGGYYFEMDFKYRNPFGEVSGTLMDSKLTWTTEARVRAGVELGDGAEFVMGVGYELTGAPDLGDEGREFVFEESFRRKLSLVLTAGFSWRFALLNPSRGAPENHEVVSEDAEEAFLLLVAPATRT